MCLAYQTSKVASIFKKLGGSLNVVETLEMLFATREAPLPILMCYLGIRPKTGISRPNLMKTEVSYCEEGQQ